MPLRIRKKVERGSSKLIYLQVKEMLRNSIERGELKQGEPLPGRVKLCEMFGTNRLTVDRAIRELMREGWLISVKGKGTFVSHPNSRPSTATMTFAIVWSQRGISEQQNIYWAPLLRGIAQTTSELGIQLQFREMNPTFYLDFFRESHADGMIVLAPTVEDELVLKDLRKHRVPFVATSSIFDDKSLPCIGIDNFSGVKQALEHLWSLGHRQIAIVDLDLRQTDLLQRWDAFRKLMGEAGYKIDPRWALLYPDRWCIDKEEYVRQWLKSIPLPTAIFAADYEMTIAVFVALKDLGLKIPDQISLLGFDDPPMVALLEPPLTSIRQPVEEIGQRAVKKLYDALQKGVMPEGTEVLMTELIVRASTAPFSQDRASIDIQRSER
ncbi:MAG: GntR family transcriptional regulator [Armatimonadetes bacterium]|nr:GntR family transcriptional regulator [Armatimonadota bacterium]MDW8028630.1 GntR family transcriptional regulator [Armatimonadota bacterium]